MKLRGIELTNVRRFAGRRAILSDLGDGVTVLSEPNEFGKSTFFDALHALFFERHRSSRAPVKALQPHAGGAPEISAEIELPEGRFRLHKRFLSRPQARVTDAEGRLIAQEDEAEAWIDRLMGGDLAGPSGLLWVRQGLLGLEPEGASADERRERERGLGARRELLSSVAGEIDMMTGGRRMDLVLARVTDEMARLATATGRPRAGGEWARAIEEAATLAQAEAEAQDKAQRLSGDLTRRAEVQRRLARLSDPQAARLRAQALAEAQAAHQAARAHADRTQQAERDLKLAQLDEAGARARIDQVQQLTLRLDQARAARAEAEARAASLQARAEDLAQRDRRAAADLQAAAQATRASRARLAVAQRARLAQAARSRAADLTRSLERAEALQAQMQADRAERARLTVTPKAMAALEAAQTALDRAQARAEAQAVCIEALPDGPPATWPDGAPLGPGMVPVMARTRLDLPGFGVLIVDPGLGQGAVAAVAQAQDALDRALAQCGAADLPEARRQLALAQRLDDATRQGAQTLEGLAPEGLETLRTACATALAEADSAPAEAEDPAPLERELAATEAAEAEAQATARGAHEAAIAAGEARADGEGERRSAERALAEMQDEAGAPEDLAARLQALQADLPGLSARHAAAALQVQDLAASAPDLTTAEAALTRAASAAEQARRDLEGLREELAALNMRIEILAEEGIEELRDDVTGRRITAQARAARFEAEMAALTRLRTALDQARSRQRDAYFRPVLRELQPLLAILHPGAALQIDDDSLLPHAMTRDGQAETLDILSGGTREQVAILTRLAFARLFAQAGRPVPVILDDALVHTDDDRIEAMFTALHRVAADQQVLVLTCRQRAFESLGGARAQVRIEAV
ncbi:chromosome segregation protein SMC [Paracoccus liaowanqingii]|uniref:Chromosome segregation protein SMC n=1 Tax=Paracoccus liaowanqingii TaxID=2560053 RepID=A0A4P7HKY6_9RHOB|nr:ATP-binding protein [Paracoccus liaowanqingii]QBX34816.1 chromosome segregation protein SMC [Paracoccus liaowanqingii]